MLLLHLLVESVNLVLRLLLDVGDVGVGLGAAIALLVAQNSRYAQRVHSSTVESLVVAGLDL